LEKIAAAGQRFARKASAKKQEAAATPAPQVLT
jgi:hypothetical protein